MKVIIETNIKVKEPEIIIRCGEITEDVIEIQRSLLKQAIEPLKITFYKEDTEYFLPINDILFFEIEGSILWAHTATEEYRIKYRLYELEEILPRFFVRVSKSTILNSKKVYSIVRNLTAASKVSFYGSPKTVYVSRRYYGNLKDTLARE